MKIPDDKIDEIRQATDIVDLIGGFVRLKKRGKNHVGLCPFHTEKTPSFNVSAGRQMYHCFGCGVGGNVFTFLMQQEKISFVEAVRSLAKAAGIEIPEPGASTDTGEPTEQDRAYALLRIAAQHFHRCLTETQEGKMALEYLKHRGVTEGTIRHFGLGYALNSWDAFVIHAREHGYGPEFVEKYGLARKREEGGYYDYFRGRVTFPVFTPAGRVVGFGARKLREDDPLGKYINSPESPVYNKSRILYGIFQSKEAIRETDAAILVEGYLDLISLFQEGIKNVVASSGTALTVEQTQLVRRYTKNIIIMYDADSAGSKASMRGVDVVLGEDMDVKVVKLPEGEDPDTFVRKAGSGGFKKLLDGSLSFVDAIIEARKGMDSSPEERSKTVRMLIRTIAQMPDELKRDLYIKHIAEKVSIRESVLQTELAAAFRAESTSQPRQFRAQEMPEAGGAPGVAGESPRQASSIPPEERDLFTAVLRGGEDVVRFMLAHLKPEEFSHPVTRGLAALLSARLEEGESIEPAALVDAVEESAATAPGGAKEFISGIMLAIDEPAVASHPGILTAERGEPLRIATDAVIAMKKRNVREQKRANRELQRQTSERGGDVEVYQKRNIELDEELRRLEKQGLGS